MARSSVVFSGPCLAISAQSVHQLHIYPTGRTSERPAGPEASLDTNRFPRQPALPSRDELKVRDY